MPVSTAGALVFPLLMKEQHNTLWLSGTDYQINPKICQHILYLIVLCHKMLVFPFLALEQHTTFKESMINRLSNLIHRNRSAAKISQVLCSNI